MGKNKQKKPARQAAGSTGTNTTTQNNDATTRSSNATVGLRKRAIDAPDANHTFISSGASEEPTLPIIGAGNELANNLAVAGVEKGANSKGSRKRAKTEGIVRTVLQNDRLASSIA